VLRQRKLRQGRCTVTDSSAAFSGKCGGAPCWMRIYRIKPYLRNIDGIGKEIVDLHLDSDQHQNVITSRGSSLAHTYHVWWTRSQGILLTEWQTDRQQQSHDSALAEWQYWQLAIQVTDDGMTSKNLRVIQEAAGNGHLNEFTMNAMLREWHGDCKE